MLQLMGSQRVGHDLGLNKKNNTKIQRMGKTKILTQRLIFLKRHYPIRVMILYFQQNKNSP